MQDAYGEFEASALFCPRCRRAVAVRRKLLLVLPTGDKYDYVCQHCGTSIGAKLDASSSAYRDTARAAASAARRTPAGARNPASRPLPPR